MPLYLVMNTSAELDQYVGPFVSCGKTNQSIFDEYQDDPESIFPKDVPQEFAFGYGFTYCQEDMSLKFFLYPFQDKMEPSSFLQLSHQEQKQMIEDWYEECNRNLGRNFLHPCEKGK